MDVVDVLRLIVIHLKKGNIDSAIAVLESAIQQLEAKGSDDGSS